MRSSSIVKMAESIRGIPDHDNKNAAFQFGPNIVRAPSGVRTVALAKNGSPILIDRSRRTAVSNIHSNQQPADINFCLVPPRQSREAFDNIPSILKSSFNNVADILRAIPSQDSAIQAFRMGNIALWHEVLNSELDVLPVQLDHRFDIDFSRSLLLQEGGIFREILSSYDNACLLQDSYKKAMKGTFKIDDPEKMSTIYRDGTDFFWDITGEKEIRAMRVSPQGLVSTSTSSNLVLPYDPDIIAEKLKNHEISPSLFMVFAPLAAAECVTLGGSVQIAYQPAIRHTLAEYMKATDRNSCSERLSKSDFNRWGQYIMDWSEYFDLKGERSELTLNDISAMYSSKSIRDTSDNLSLIRQKNIGNYLQL